MAEAKLGQVSVEMLPTLGSRCVDCFEKLEKIGEGTYGWLISCVNGSSTQVFMARETRTGEIVALKELRMNNEKQGFPITSIREIKILKQLSHCNIVKLKEIVTSLGRVNDGKNNQGNKFDDGIYLVFEYMDHDLAGLLDHPGQKFTVPQIKSYMKQLLSGLHYCHFNGVFHRDIKGANLLIDNEGTLKIADFGLAKRISPDLHKNLTNPVITLWYRPPELLFGAKQYGPAVDMWSSGCIFAELLHGKPIFKGKTELEQLSKIFELCGSPDETNWPDVSKTPFYKHFKPSRPMKRLLRKRFRYFDRHALDLLDNLLTLDPKQRWTAKQALNADYFWNEPAACDLKSLPKYESSHAYQMKQKREQQKQEMEKRQKEERPRPHSDIATVQHSSRLVFPWHGPNHPVNNPQPSALAVRPRSTFGSEHVHSIWGIEDQVSGHSSGSYPLQ